jgi:hypothetical protein
MIPYNGNGNFAVRTTLTFLLTFLLHKKYKGHMKEFTFHINPREQFIQHIFLRSDIYWHFHKKKCLNNISH